MCCFVTCHLNVDVPDSDRGLLLVLYTRGDDVLVVVFVFFFKQKTAYEMRISDWSSDVCSSDLGVERPIEIALDRIVPARLGVPEQRQGFHGGRSLRQCSPVSCPIGAPEERRVSTRAIASSSVTRAIPTPGGNAASRREGIAADSKTNAPRSRDDRISRSEEH